MGRAYNRACLGHVAYQCPHKSMASLAHPHTDAPLKCSLGSHLHLPPAGMWVTEEQAPAARLAAQLAAQGLAAGLPPADTADPGMQDSLLKLCRMLSKKGHWDLLDLLVAGPCASL